MSSYEDVTGAVDMLRKLGYRVWKSELEPGKHGLRHSDWHICNYFTDDQLIDFAKSKCGNIDNVF